MTDLLDQLRAIVGAPVDALVTLAEEVNADLLVSGIATIVPVMPAMGPSAVLIQIADMLGVEAK